MPTFYVEDYDGDRNDDAVEAVTLAPVSDVDGPQAKVVEAPVKTAAKKSPAKVTTKG